MAERRLRALDSKPPVSGAAVTGAVVGFLLRCTLSVALTSVAAWLAIEVVAGIDLSLREAVGAGLLLTFASASRA